MLIPRYEAEIARLRRELEARGGAPVNSNGTPPELPREGERSTYPALAPPLNGADAGACEFAGGFLQLKMTNSAITLPTTRASTRIDRP